VSLTLQPGQLELAVTDCGPGIADDQKIKVFERFYAIPKTDRRVTDAATPAADLPTTGSGLGLAIVQSISQAHGGQALVRDNQPHGAILVLLLPMAK
jgi:signal transduction histidine kinase